MDSEVGLNRQRQALARCVPRYDRPAQQREADPGRRLPDTGSTADGNQVAYRCDAKQVVTIDFDAAQQAPRAGAALGKKADALSMEMDGAWVNTEVDYTPPFESQRQLRCDLTDFIEKAAGGRHAGA